MFENYLKRVVTGDCLNTEEAYSAAKLLLHGNISEAKAAAFLGALRTRGEKAAELSGFVQALYEEALVVDPDLEVIDTCGTGGDGLGTFNISTAAALVVAGCGVPVAKHGNRAVTGNVGSADVLEALGVNIQLEPDEALHLLDKAGITFFFAPNYHPILKQLGKLRREMGVSTIFNFLGPLLNPCKPSYQVLGISDPRLLEAVAETLVFMGCKRGLVICAENGMDEISPVCSTRVCEIQEEVLTFYSINPDQLGISPFTLDSIKGGNININAGIVQDVLEGKPGPHRETVVLNASAALVVAGRANSIREGMELAYEAIDSGKAKAVLANMIKYSRDRVIK
ncbi:MAG: anthranilate phosphoribosyltransferase [Syntrophomonadaceae bacterium]|nr:anthranilate phosphoribosyltransferase [Syntrophomonadaceae bacterium]